MYWKYRQHFSQFANLKKIFHKKKKTKHKYPAGWNRLMCDASPCSKQNFPEQAVKQLVRRSVVLPKVFALIHSKKSIDINEEMCKF